jgi:hypothetical protein
MATEAQIIANRRNSQKSTGPRSPEGKAVVSKNAVKHGLFASENVIKGENREDFDLFRDEMLSKLAPVGPVESMLAERVVSLSWRLSRIGRMTNQAIDVMIERDGPSPLTKQLRLSLPKFIRDVQDDPRGSGPELVLGRAAIKDYTNSRVLDRLLMYERRIENSMIKMMDELKSLRLIRELKEAGIADIRRPEVQDAGNKETRESGCGNQDSRESGRTALVTRDSDNHCLVTGYPDTHCNLKKQSQSAPAQMGANSFAGEDYENKLAGRLQKNKANRRPSAGNPKHEILNPKQVDSRRAGKTSLS